MNKVSKQEVLEALREVVNEYGPETKYADIDPDYWQVGVDGPAQVGSCRYLDQDKKPMCIVGKVLVEKLGWKPEDGIRWAILDRNYGLAVSGRDFIPFMDEDALELLYEAQSAQDQGHTWGSALQRAEAVA